MIRAARTASLLALSACCLSCTPSGSLRLREAPQTKDDVRRILHYASLAGSSHNSQPWRVEVFGRDSLLVFADTTRSLPVVDHSGRELHISIGAFLENLRIAAASLSYVAEIDPLPGEASGPLARIRLVPGQGLREEFKPEDLERRTTSRIPFGTAPIRPQDVEALLRIDRQSVHLFPADSPEGRLIATGEVAAYRQQARDPLAQEELARWIRFSDRDVLARRDGLTTAGMGIDGLAGLYVRHVYTPEDSRTEAFVSKGIEKTVRQVEGAGGWIVLTQRDDASGWLRVGRLYERLNLECRRLGLGFHPMNQIVEERGFGERIASQLRLPGKILFVARTGYVQSNPDPVSPRRPADSFTTFRQGCRPEGPRPRRPDSP